MVNLSIQTSSLPFNAPIVRLLGPCYCFLQSNTCTSFKLTSQEPTHIQIIANLQTNFVECMAKTISMLRSLKHQRCTCNPKGQSSCKDGKFVSFILHISNHLIQQKLKLENFLHLGYQLEILEYMYFQTCGLYNMIKKTIVR
jgi:hypothetical protein